MAPPPQALQYLTAAASDRGTPLLVNDLWADMIGYCGAYYSSCALQLPKDVHLTPAGINFTANSAFKAIMGALGDDAY